MIPYKTIFKYSEWSVERRYNYLIILIIFVLGSVIVYLNDSLDDERTRYNIDMYNVRIRNNNTRATLEAKLEACNENYLNYIKTNKEEYQELLYQIRKLQEQ